MLHSAIAVAVAMAAATSSLDTAWIDGIQDLGWAISGYGGDTLQFSRAAPAPANSPFKRVWVRYESKTVMGGGADTYWSSSSLYEVDCTQVRFRTLQTIHYTKPNLAGGSTQYNPPVPDWSYPAPGTLAEGMASRACGLATKQP